MRKRLKKKLRSCPMCKSFKMHGSNRWKPKELQKLKESEKDFQEAVRR